MAAGLTGALSQLPFIGGALGGLAADAEKQKALDELENSRMRWAGLDLPEYSQAQLHAEEFTPTLYGDPEAAQYVTVTEDPRLRNAQLEALQRMQGTVADVSGAVGQAARATALRDAQSVAGSRENAMGVEAARRGAASSGLDYVMRQQSAQNAANAAQAGTLGAVQQEALLRMQGLSGLEGMASSIRNQDFSNEARNNAVINEFNAANTALRNQTAAANTALQNQAGLLNTQNKQSVGKFNLERGDKNKTQSFQNAVAKEGGYSGLTSNIASTMNNNTEKNLDRGEKERSKWESLFMAGMGGG